MFLTLTWGTGPSARTWSPTLPGTAELGRAVAALGVPPPEPCTLKAALQLVEPLLMVAAEAAGAGAPELLVVIGAVTLTKNLLASGARTAIRVPARPADPAPTPAKTTRALTAVA